MLTPYSSNLDLRNKIRKNKKTKNTKIFIMISNTVKNRIRLLKVRKTRKISKFKIEFKSIWVAKGQKCSGCATAIALTRHKLHH